MGGVFITIEGIEGSGKSTQVEALNRRLSRLGVPFVISREPGGTRLGCDLRSLILTPHPSGETWSPEAELLLFYADRAQHLATLVKPALEAGKVVLVDRFEDSTRAYQGAQGVPETTLDRLSDLVLGPFRPNLTILLDMDPVASLQRVAHRNAGQDQVFTETRFDSEALEFHQRVRTRFLALAQRHPQRMAVVPCAGDPEQVESVIWTHIAPLLRSHGHRIE